MFIPALFTTMSMRPYCARMVSATFCTAAAFATSAGCIEGLPPASVIFPATASSGSLRRPVSTTSAPTRASASAAPSPMPVPAPVTQATLPSRDCIDVLPACLATILTASPAGLIGRLAIATMRKSGARACAWSAGGWPVRIQKGFLAQICAIIPPAFPLCADPGHGSQPYSLNLVQLGRDQWTSEPSAQTKREGDVMPTAEIIGYLASALVFATFYMKTIVSLRV